MPTTPRLPITLSMAAPLLPSNPLSAHEGLATLTVRMCGQPISEQPRVTMRANHITTVRHCRLLMASFPDLGITALFYIAPGCFTHCADARETAVSCGLVDSGLRTDGTRRHTTYQNQGSSIKLPQDEQQQPQICIHGVGVNEDWRTVNELPCGFCQARHAWTRLLWKSHFAAFHASFEHASCEVLGLPAAFPSRIDEPHDMSTRL